MSTGFEATKKVMIRVPPQRVWEALTDPAQVKEYMHGTNLFTDWTVGSPIFWKGEWKGRSYEDKGTVLEYRPPTLLRCTHWSPMGGSEDRPENYHTVTYKLEEQPGGTLLTLVQDNNSSQEAADQIAENNWGPVLDGVKKTAEK